MVEHKHVWSAWTTEPRQDGVETMLRLVKRCLLPGCDAVHWEDDPNGSTA